MSRWLFFRMCRSRCFKHTIEWRSVVVVSPLGLVSQWATGSRRQRLLSHATSDHPRADDRTEREHDVLVLLSLSHRCTLIVSSILLSVDCRQDTLTGPRQERGRHVQRPDFWVRWSLPRCGSADKQRSYLASTQEQGSMYCIFNISGELSSFREKHLMNRNEPRFYIHYAVRISWEILSASNVHLHVHVRLLVWNL